MVQPIFIQCREHMDNMGATLSAMRNLLLYVAKELPLPIHQWQDDHHVAVFLKGNQQRNN